MAWEKHYILQWRDLWGVRWTANLLTQDYPSDPEYLEGSDEAIVFEFRNDTDAAFGCLKPSSVTLNVIRDTPFKFMDLYTGGIMTTWIEIFQGDDDSSAGVPYWTGWLDTSNYDEPYEPGECAIQLSCTDGLSLLEDILFASSVISSEGEEEITYYNGRQYISQILLDILGKIGYSEFKEFVNLYEEEMVHTSADSPFDQGKVDVDVFQDKNCSEVLRKLLEPFNASIRQHEGVFCIYRPKELVNSTVYGRYFTGSQTKTSITLSPNQYFNRVGHNTNLKQVPGGNTTLEDPARKIKMNFDYGDKESWIDDYKFDADSFDGVSEWHNWTRVGGDYNKPIGNYVTGEKEGVAIINQDIIPTSYLYQEFGQGAIVSASDLFVVEFDYGTFNTTASSIANVSIGIAIYQTSPTNSLKDVDGTQVEWSELLGATLTELVSAPVGWSGWSNYRRQLIGIEKADILKIELYGDPNYPGDVYICFKNIRFYSTSANILAKRKVRSMVQRIDYAAGFIFGVWRFSKNKYYTTRTIELIENIIEDNYVTGNDLEGQEIEKDYVLGDITDSEIDNLLCQFKGALSTIKRDTLSDAADDFYTDHNASYSGLVITTPSNTIVFSKSSGAFTGATSITNATGNLSGTVENTQAYAPGQNKKVRVFPNTSTGSYDITCTGCDPKTMAYDTNQQLTCEGFVSAWSGYYNGLSITITAAQETGGALRWYVQFEAASDITVGKENQTPSFDVDIETAQAYIAVTPAIHTITLTGDYGTANIVCNGVAAKDIEIDETEMPTREWATREEQSSGGMKKLLELIGDEIKHQYSRHTQLLTNLTIQELAGEMLSPASSDDESTLNLLGNLQDTENQVNGENRIFVINRGTFNARSREWRLDLAEIVR